MNYPDFANMLLKEGEPYKTIVEFVFKVGIIIIMFLMICTTYVATCLRVFACLKVFGFRSMQFIFWFFTLMVVITET